MRPRSLVVASIGIAGVALIAAANRHGEVAGPGVATVQAAEVDVTIARGEPLTKTHGGVAVHVPREIALAGGAFDVVLHFHGASSHQERNASEAGLRAVLVTANEGVGTTPYARAFAPPGSLDRLLGLAEQAFSESGRIEGRARVRRVALSSWSAGGAAVRAILQDDAARIDAVLLADGLFSRYADPATKAIEQAPLEPFVRFARRAIDGEALMLVTHTAIETPRYPNVKECTDEVLSALDLPASEDDVYALDRGELHVRGSAGKGPGDHVDELRALDQGYAMLARRWAR